MISESLSIKEGLAGRVDRASKNSLQNKPLALQAEHLRDTEGLDEVGATEILETRWKEDEIGVATVARRTLGTGFGEH
jgi:hypothetical protein